MQLLLFKHFLNASKVLDCSMLGLSITDNSNMVLIEACFGKLLFHYEVKKDLIATIKLLEELNEVAIAILDRKPLVTNISSRFFLKDLIPQASLEQLVIAPKPNCPNKMLVSQGTNEVIFDSTESGLILFKKELEHGERLLSYLMDNYMVMDAAPSGPD